MKAVFYTIFALVAFAFNSILCRLALQSGEIDAASFTLIRLLSGALILLPVSLNQIRERRSLELDGNWFSAFFLFAYAVCFSFAYVNLTIATGALILFGSVQATMLFTALFKGERPRFLELLGILLALGGLAYLVFPGLTAPPLWSSVLMAAAGAAWGFYTLRGRTGGGANPIANTSGNFLRSIPMIVLASLPFLPQIHLSGRAIWLAAASGAIASGIGYSAWYAALKFHTATRAAVLQLAVPILTAAGGILFLSETLSVRLLTASALILGGIAVSIFGRKI